MAQSEPTPERLTDLLNDERARRAWAEAQLAAEKEKTRVWRARAEERAAELRRLKWRRAGRKGSPASKTSPPLAPRQGGSEPAAGDAMYPAVLAGECDAPPWLQRAFGTLPIDQPSTQLEALDLVVAGSDRAFGYLKDWLGWDGRPPLILTGSVSAEVWGDFVHQGDVSIGNPIGEARVVAVSPALVDRTVVAPPAEAWTDVIEATDVGEVIGSVARGEALVWTSDDPVPSALDGMVATDSSGDPGRSSVLGRLRARRRHGLAGFLERLGEAAGLSLPSAVPTVGVLLVTNRPDRLAAALDGISRFDYPRIDVVVGLHGPGFDEAPQLLEEWESRRGVAVRPLSFAEDMTLGECLNRCADVTAAPILAKIDDDDIYGPWYLDEAVDVALSSGADLVGKATFGMILEGGGDLVLQALGKENSEVPYVPGASFVFPRHTWERVPFAHRRSRIDSTWVRGLRSLGMSIWSSSRYEFVVRRSVGGHTWETSERLLRAQGHQIGTAEEWPSLMLEG